MQVVGVVPGSQAERNTQSLAPGLRIATIDGVSTAGRSLRDVRAHLDSCGRPVTVTFTPAPRRVESKGLCGSKPCAAPESMSSRANRENKAWEPRIQSGGANSARHVSRRTGSTPPPAGEGTAGEGATNITLDQAASSASGPSRAGGDSAASMTMAAMQGLEDLKATDEEADTALSLWSSLSHACFGPHSGDSNANEQARPPIEMVLRFLRATDHKVSATTRMLQRHLAWREQWRPDTITPADIEVSLATGNTRFLGLSNAGNPVLWCQVKLWRPQDFSVEEQVRYITYVLSSARAQATRVQLRVPPSVPCTRVCRTQLPK